MKLLMNHYPYRLEQSYELGFGPSVYEAMADLILAFREPEQDILFLYINWEKNSDPHRDDLIESDAGYFHSDIIYDPDQLISQKVKETLLHYYAPELEVRDNQAFMDELLSQFRATGYEELDEELLFQVGTAVHDMVSKYTLDDQDEATKAFVNNRLLFSNSAWLFTNERPVNLKNLLWYRVNTKEEIIQSFELTDWWFTCVILNADTPVEEYDFFLNYTEEHGDDHDGMVLYISPKSTDHFKKNVLSRLQELLGNKLEVE